MQEHYSGWCKSLLRAKNEVKRQGGSGMRLFSSASGAYRLHPFLSTNGSIRRPRTPKAAGAGAATQEIGRNVEQSAAAQRRAVNTDHLKGEVVKFLATVRARHAVLAADELRLRPVRDRLRSLNDRLGRQ